MRAPSSTCAKAHTRVRGPMSLDSMHPSGCAKNCAGAAAGARAFAMECPVLIASLLLGFSMPILKPLGKPRDPLGKWRRGPEPRGLPEILDICMRRDHVPRL